MSLLLIAHTTKGFEKVTESEIFSRISDVSNVEVRTKQVLFKTNSFGSLPKLFTVNDLSVLVVADHPFTDKHSKIVLTKNIIEDILKARDHISKLRRLDDTFSITVSRYKNKTEIASLTDLLSQRLMTELDMEFTPRSHDNFDIRIELAPETYTISIRLGDKPAFHREYKVQSQTGALRPSIAGAMLFASVGASTGLKIVDNLCGSGTILCEASLSGNIPSGGDISESGVTVSQANITTLNPKFTRNIRKLDAVSSPWKDDFFDVAISNLPWDKQVETDSIMSLYEDVIKEYARIVKPGGTIGILSKKPDLVTKYLKKYGEVNKLTQYKLGFLGQNPTLVIANPMIV